MLRQVNNPKFLGKDSYVELTHLVRNYEYDVQRAQYLGRMSPAEAKQLVVAVDRAETLIEAHKRIIREQLASLISTR